MEKRAISLEDEAGMSGFFVAGHIMMTWMLRWINININSMIYLAVGRRGGGAVVVVDAWIGNILGPFQHTLHIIIINSIFMAPHPCSSAYHSLTIKCRGRGVPNVQLHKCKHRWTHRLHRATCCLTHRFNTSMKFKILTNLNFNKRQNVTLH